MSKRILIIRLGALGDVANVMPAVAGLRRARPGDHLTWLVEEAASGLLEICGHIDEVIVFPRRDLSRALKRPWLWPWFLWRVLRFSRDLRRERFDRVLDFQAHLKSGLLAWSTRAPWRAGYARSHGREGSHLFLNVHVLPSPEAVSRRERAVTLAQSLVPELVPADPELKPTEADVAVVRDFLGQLPDGTRVLIHPGSSHFGRFKRWPASRFGEVARRLASERGCVPLIIHGPQEPREVLDEAVSASDGHAVPAPALSLPQLMALCREAELFIGGDSGPLHVAALVGTPCVAIFGPKDPAVYAPSAARIVRRNALECSPCTRRRCSHTRCLQEITVEQVTDAAVEVLESHSAGRHAPDFS